VNTAQRIDSSYYLRNLLRFLSEIDWWLILATSLLVVVGLSTLRFTGAGVYDKQLAYMWVGVIACLIFWRAPYIIWTHRLVIPVIWGVNLALLLAVMLKGHSALGAQRWLAIGPITLQPSELAKLVIIFSLAAWLKSHPIKGFFDTFKALAIIVPPAILVFKQPDLGTSLTFGAVFLGMCFWSGSTVLDILVLLSPIVSLIMHALNTHWWLIWLGILACVLFFFWRKHNWRFPMRTVIIAAIVAMNFGCGLAQPHFWGLLKEYQQKRLTSFLNPYDDPRGSGYHILQSLIAIGSGGLNGLGLGHGNQSQGAFIPERQTDFVFAVVGEELGFKVTTLVVLAYCIICIRALIIAYQAREEPAGSLIAIGIMSMFLFHVFLNIGMTMGIMPVAGVPLPFLSYGGTAMVVDLVAIGLLQSIRFYNPPPRQDVWR
jgi:rod shape determining protein RodA